MTLEIAGTKFRLIADADEQHLAELAGMVNDRVAKLGGVGRASAAQMLALVALGLADDLKNAERKLREVDHVARSTITQLVARIDQRLVQDHPEPKTQSEQGQPAGDS